MSRTPHYNAFNKFGQRSSSLLPDGIANSEHYFFDVLSPGEEPCGQITIDEVFEASMHRRASRIAQGLNSIDVRLVSDHIRSLQRDDLFHRRK